MSTFFRKLSNNYGALAILIDPDKESTLENLLPTLKAINLSSASFIFVGGSTGNFDLTETVVQQIKKNSDLPVILFPGDPCQVTDSADALLYLSLTSGRNSEFLIGKQVESANRIWKMNIEKIPTSYVLIDGGNSTSVSRVSNTSPLSQSDFHVIHDTIKASIMLGMSCVYLDAGSGAKITVNVDLVKEIRMYFSGLLLVGGGVNSISTFMGLKNAGANVIVIGNKIESDLNFLANFRS